jgi:hypothetical protein
VSESERDRDRVSESVWPIHAGFSFFSYVSMVFPGERSGAIGILTEELKGMRLEMQHLVGSIPKGMITRVITRSQASAHPQNATSLFDTLELEVSLKPPVVPIDHKYQLPEGLGKEWKSFTWSWQEAEKKLAEEPKEDEAEGEDKFDLPAVGDPDYIEGLKGRDPLEASSYPAVVEFLSSVHLVAANVANGNGLPNGLLFNQEIWTQRQQDPRIPGQVVTMVHIVKGRTDIVVLKEQSDEIRRFKVKFAIEVKTVSGMKSSRTGSRTEALVQLIGLNANNPKRSPPVVLTNLTGTHVVLTLKLKAPSPSAAEYVVEETHCRSFAAAVHLANTLSENPSQSQDFSRPKTPDNSDNS